MSTESHILQLELGKKLVRLRPSFRGNEREARRISVLPSIDQWLNDARGSLTVKANTRAQMGAFVKGELVDDLNDIKRVENASLRDNFSDEVWAFRTLFIPKYRFFGAFAIPDWLIILAMKERDNIKTDAHWTNQITKVTGKWDALFEGIPRHSGGSLSDYLTFEAEHLDDRW